MSCGQSTDWGYDPAAIGQAKTMLEVTVGIAMPRAQIPKYRNVNAGKQ
jgi:hypothetical protein